MEKLLLTTKIDTTKLQAMMFMDVGNYLFQKTAGGLLIEFNEENPESMDAFIRRFSEWFAKESFLLNGNQYFENHEQKEKWEIWKQDFRFVETYCDDVYRALIERKWGDLLYRLDNYVAIQISLEDLLNSVSELSKMRLKLVAEHFTEGIHENYILLRMGLKESQNDVLPI